MRGLDILRGLTSPGRAHRPVHQPLGADRSRAIDLVRRVAIEDLATCASEALGRELRNAIARGDDIAQIGVATMGSTTQGIRIDGSRFSLVADVRIEGETVLRHLRIRGDLDGGIDSVDEASPTTIGA